VSTVQLVTQSSLGILISMHYDGFHVTFYPYRTSVSFDVLESMSLLN